MGYDIGADQKQHINLSQYAWTVIHEDMLLFNDHGKELSLSGFLNTIINNYKDIAHCTISIQLEKKYNELIDLFTKPKFDSYESTVIQSLIESIVNNHKKELLKTAIHYQKSDGKKFRLNNDNADYFYYESNEDRYFESLGAYLKPLFEEYARLKFFEREQIYYKEVLSTIEEAVNAKQLLSVSLFERVTPDGRHVSPRTFHLKPYAIKTDTIGLFNYVVGYSIDTDKTTKKKEKVVSLRLSHIKKLRKLLSQSGKIVQQKIKDLEGEIEQKGVQFLSTNVDKVVLKLTPQGVESYNRQLHLRPKYVKRDENTYYFNCSERQIFYYFFKFGKDVVIIKPEYLRNIFKRNYQLALDNYF